MGKECKVTKSVGWKDIVAKAETDSGIPKKQIEESCTAVVKTLQTMIEQERKTGVLTLTRSDQLAWLTFVDGRLVRVRASDHRGDSRSTLMRVLDWTDGYFELAAGGAEGEAELEESITHLLLEHARVADERSRSKPS